QPDQARVVQCRDRAGRSQPVAFVDVARQHGRCSAGIRRLSPSRGGSALPEGGSYRPDRLELAADPALFQEFSMPVKVAINGYGRIGRNILRALYESGRTGEIRIVAINDLGDAGTNAHLTRFDTALGKFNAEVSVEGDHMIVIGDRIRVCAERDPSKLPWGELGVDVVYVCSGLFT